jgi:DNA-directed RNA polymerase subunit RPC12/RpoP
MKCPKCKKEIDSVRIYSQCYQVGELKDNKIINYGSVEEILETLGIECPECSEDITKHIEE